MVTASQGDDDNPTPAVYQPDWAPWVRQLVTVGLVIAAVYALTLLAPVTNILITTFLLSFLMFIPARFVARWTPLNYPASVVLIFLILLTLLILLLLVLVPNLVNMFRNIGEGLYARFMEFQESLRAWDPAKGPYTLSILGLFQLDISDLAAQLRPAVLAPSQQEAQQIAQEVLINRIPPIDIGQIINTATQIISGLIGAVSGFFSTLITAMLLSLVILLELPNYQKGLLHSFTEGHRREVWLLGSHIVRVWQGFFRGQVVLCLLIGVLTFAQLVLMGVQAALPLAAIVALVSLIPTLGGILALAPLFIVPLIQGSTVFVNTSPGTFALLVVAANLVISQVMWNVVAPKIMGNAVSLPLPVIILGIIVGAALGGVLGAFLIVPSLGTIRVIVLYLIAKINRHDPFPNEVMPANAGTMLQRL